MGQSVYLGIGVSARILSSRIASARASWSGGDNFREGA
jgi:hypothetical protein